MVTEGLSEAMTGDLSENPNSFDSSLDDTPSLNPADRSFLLPAVREDMLSPAMRLVEFEGLYDLLVERDGLLLAGFMLGQGNMRLKPSTFFVIDIAPAEAQEVTDPQRRAGRHNNHRIVTILPSKQEIVGEVLKLFFVSNRFGRCHNDWSPSMHYCSIGRSAQGRECNRFYRLLPLYPIRNRLATEI